MNPNERRLEIIEILIRRKKETIANLAYEFGVSERTIKRDIDTLSLSYPIETIRGNGGGVVIRAGYVLHQKFLKPAQKELLERLCQDLSGIDLITMNSIIHDFAFN